LSKKQYDALAANCSDLFMRTMLTLAYFFGFRKAELIGSKKAKQPPLKDSDVNLLAGTLQLRDSKNGEPRKVALTGDAKNLLAACITGKGPEDSVFARKCGNAVKDFGEPGARLPWPLASLAYSSMISAALPSVTWCAGEYRRQCA
jgi:hypothetical protein